MVLFPSTCISFSFQDDSMFKMSSCSSLHSSSVHEPSESEFSGSRQMDVSVDMKDLIGGHSPFVGSRQRRDSRSKQGIDFVTHQQNKLLSKKLDGMIAAHLEMKRMLDHQIMQGVHHDIPKNPADVLTSLEEHTDDLRRALLTRYQNQHSMSNEDPDDVDSPRAMVRNTSFTSGMEVPQAAPTLTPREDDDQDAIEDDDQSDEEETSVASVLEKVLETKDPAIMLPTIVEGAPIGSVTTIINDGAPIASLSGKDFDRIPIRKGRTLFLSSFFFGRHC